MDFLLNCDEVALNNILEASAWEISALDPDSAGSTSVQDIAKLCYESLGAMGILGDKKIRKTIFESGLDDESISRLAAHLGIKEEDKWEIIDMSFKKRSKKMLRSLRIFR